MYADQQEDTEDQREIMEVASSNAPPVSSFIWVIQKVVEVSRRMIIFFEGMEQRVEELFKEIESKRSWSPKSWKGISRGKSKGRNARELKSL